MHFSAIHVLLTISAIMYYQLFQLSSYIAYVLLTISAIQLHSLHNITDYSRLEHDWQVSESHGAEEIEDLWQGSLPGDGVRTGVHVDGQILRRR